MMNTPRVCMQETKKAFRKLSKDDLLGAVQALCNLKGVGPQMASGESYNSRNLGRMWKMNFTILF